MSVAAEHDDRGRRVHTKPGGRRARQASVVEITQPEIKFKALELRIRGTSYRKIAGELDCTEGDVFQTVQDALKETPREPPETVRSLELSRLDAMWKAVYPKAMVGDCSAINICLRISETRLQLEGVELGSNQGSKEVQIDPAERARQAEEKREQIIKVMERLAEAQKMEQERLASPEARASWEREPAQSTLKETAN